MILTKLIEFKNIEVNDLPQELKNLFLVYFTGDSLTKFGFERQHEISLKNYLSVLLLSEKLNKNLNIEPLMKKLLSNIADIKDIMIPAHSKVKL